MTSSTVRLYLSTSYPCNYLPYRTARSQILTSPHPVTDNLYYALIHHGFRRSGDIVYRPYCISCNLCIPIRVPVQLFNASRSQKRALKHHSMLTVEWIRPTDSPEITTLYEQYQKTRHSSDEKANFHDQLSQFLIVSPVDTWMILFRLKNELKIVSVIDKLCDGLSAVYTFFAPNDAGSAYGTYAVLWQIEYCKQQNYPYLYLGYWIPDSPKMNYKRNFRPFEILYQDKWSTLETINISSLNKPTPHL